MVQSAIQAYGEPSWGVSLQSLTSVDPTTDVIPQAKCKKSLGSLCLDNTSLSVAAAEVIIALGCLFIVVLVAIPCVWLEWHRKTGQARHKPSQELETSHRIAPTFSRQPVASVELVQKPAMGLLYRTDKLDHLPICLRRSLNSFTPSLKRLSCQFLNAESSILG